MLGSQLLYKFERIQYSDFLKSKKQLSDIYGAIHLLRLFEKLNQTLDYAPLDDDLELQSLIYYVNDILRYIETQSEELFSENDYILAPPFYVRAAI
jgi:mortality factor 4-like protein 1